MTAPSIAPPLLEVRGLKKYFPVREGSFGKRKIIRAVDGVSFSIHRGESFGLVGESGCGKSTLGRLILALEPATAGEVLLDGNDILTPPGWTYRAVIAAKEILGAPPPKPCASKRATQALRRRMQVIFQDPFSSLNPRMTVRQILSEPFFIHRLHAREPDREKRILGLLDAVGLAKVHLDRYPHEFSGGQRQRIGIARALALNPELIVADEPVSALDVSIQAQILNLLEDLQKEFHLTYLFISHDFSVVRHLCHRIAVMYLGKIVELADARSLLEDPQHPYAEALLSAVPIPDPAVENRRRRILLAGDVPSPVDPPPGCAFHPRCRYAQPSCKTIAPPLAEAKPKHWAACPILPFKEKSSAAALIKT